MVLIIGGKYQGKREFALNVLNAAEEDIVDGLGETVSALIAQKADLKEFADMLLEEHPDAVILSDETGCGIIPADEKQRELRMCIGRLNCYLSSRADEVYRVAAGLGIRLK